MSKDCKEARNTVLSVMLLLATLVVIMSMSSCGNAGYCIQSEALYPLNKQYRK